MRGRLPVPPAGGGARRTAVGEVRAAEGAALADGLADGRERAAVLLEPARPAAASRVIVEHGAPPRGEMLDGHEAGGVRPVLEERAPAVGQFVEGGPVVGAEPAPHGQVVGAIDDVDGIELQAPRIRQQCPDARGGEGAAARAAQVLALEEEGGNRPKRNGRPRGQLLLLLLLLLGRVLDHEDAAVAPALGDLGVDGHVDVLHLLVQRGDGPGDRGPRDDLRLERLVGIAAVDPLVGRDVVIVAAVPDDHVPLVDLAIGRGIEGDPARRRRVELDPGVALGDLALVRLDVEVAAHVAAGNLAQPQEPEHQVGEVLADPRLDLQEVVRRRVVARDVLAVGEVRADVPAIDADLLAEGRG